MTDQRTGRSAAARRLDGEVTRIAGVALSRRRLLRGGGMLLGAAALSPVIAACGGSSSTPTPAPAAATVAAPTVAAPTAAATQAAQATAAAAGGAASTVNVKAHEAGDVFLFDVDKQMVAAGTTTFNFTNNGKLTHEVMVYPIQDLAEMLAKKRAGDDVEEDAYIKQMVGSAPDIEPGKGATFNSDLKPGFYELACHAIGKNPDGSTFLHFDRGQTMTLAVTGPGGPSAAILEPSSTIALDMQPGTGELASSWLFIPDHLVAKQGKVTFNITNHMDMNHDTVVYPLGNISDLIKDRLAGGENYDMIKGQQLAEDLEPNKSITATADLTPGWWVAACFVVSTLSDGTKYVHRDRGQRVTFLVA
jgi:uncharacterized cupredoxin-like copper-binding protein